MTLKTEVMAAENSALQLQKYITFQNIQNNFIIFIKIYYKNIIKIFNVSIISYSITILLYFVNKANKAILSIRYI